MKAAAHRLWETQKDFADIGIGPEIGSTGLGKLQKPSPGTRALYMTQNTFWYHPDHLGSTNWVTDHQGEGYEHFTYTPYGEAWVEEHLSSRIHRMSHRFTDQELDPETGLYAFPARNYDPRTSRWLSADPALEEYLPIAPTSDEARDHNQNLPAGGVFNPTNLTAYHYTNNNPLKYVDPAGEFPVAAAMVVLALTLTLGGSVSIPPSVDINRLQDVMNNAPYAVGDVPQIEAQGSISTYGTIRLERDPISAVAAGLLGSTIAGASDGEGNFVGDLTLNFETRGGRVTNWAVVETVPDPKTGRNVTQSLSREDALQLFTDSTRFSDEVYYSIEDIFRNN